MSVCNMAVLSWRCWPSRPAILGVYLFWSCCLVMDWLKFHGSVGICQSEDTVCRERISRLPKWVWSI